MIPTYILKSVSTSFLVPKIIMTTFYLLVLLFSTVCFVYGDYWSERQELLQKENDDSTGGSLILDEKEQAVSEILMRYKLEELDEGFNDISKFSPANHFFTAKDKITNSPVYKIIQKLPKGASLHSHDFSSSSYEAVFNFTYSENLYGCIVDDKLQLKFFAVPSEDCDWRLLSELRKESDFDLYLQSQTSMFVEDPYNVYPNGNAAWTKLSSIFGPVIDMLRFKPIFTAYFWQVLEEFYEDNVKYIEFRTILPEVYDLDGNTFGPEENIKLYVETLNEFKKQYPDFIGARLIYSPSRTVPAKDLDYHLQLALKLQKLYPDFIAGFDLVGQEDIGKPLEEYVPQLLKVAGKIKFFFHAAETDWNGAKIDTNIVDAVLLNTSRIGHGYGILKHPEIIKMITDRQIPVEVNPISNQVLRLVDDLRNHPAAYLFKVNCPVVISCDDPGMWGSKGLSYDWYMAFVGMSSRDSDLRFLKQLALNSLEYSAMTSVEKEKAMDQWQNDWEKFLDETLNSYGKYGGSQRQ